MESSSSRRHQRNRSARGPPSLPPHHRARHPSTLSLRPNPSHHHSPSAAGIYFQRSPMEDDAISTLMDIDDSPLSGAGFLDEEDGDGEMFLGPHRPGPGRGGGVYEPRGPLPFTGFFNNFDGADFDDTDLD